MVEPDGTINEFVLTPGALSAKCGYKGTCLTEIPLNIKCPFCHTPPDDHHWCVGKCRRCGAEFSRETFTMGRRVPF
jgi:rubredoxin